MWQKIVNLFSTKLKTKFFTGIIALFLMISFDSWYLHNVSVQVDLDVINIETRIYPSLNSASELKLILEKTSLVISKAIDESDDLYIEDLLESKVNFKKNIDSLNRIKLKGWLIRTSSTCILCFPIVSLRNIFNSNGTRDYSLLH